MITTACEQCCFMKQDTKGNKGCTLNQLCAIKNKQIIAPGYCRLYRGRQWVKNQKTTDLQELSNNMLEEMANFKFDMLVFFDEAINSIEDLERTLDSDWYHKYAQKVIIMDTTGFGRRKNLALQYIKNTQRPIPMIVDSSVDHESIYQNNETLRRVVKQVAAPFFMSIFAGNQVANIEKLAQIVQYIPNRVIHWSFPFGIGRTPIVPNQMNYGLFITEPYCAMVRSSKVGSFGEQFKKEEIETKMGLSWFCVDNWLI